MTSTAIATLANGERVDTGTGEVLPAVRDNRPTALLRPIAAPADVIQVQNETRAFIAATLKQGRDYGVIPGVDKKSLFQPGAERVCTGYGVYPTFRVIEQEVDHVREVPWKKVRAKYDWSSGRKGKRIGEEITEGVSLGLYRFVVECTLIERSSGQPVCTAIASASTLESKYIDRPREAENTVLQMAEKRAFVRATRTAFGLSEEFTQDVEDNPELAGDAESDTAHGAAGPAEPEARCPVCKGQMWDNREGKKNPKAPDFKCRDKSCEGVYWPGQWPPKPADPAQMDALKDGAAQIEEKPADVILAWPGAPDKGKRLGEIAPTALLHYRELAQRASIKRAKKGGDSTPYDKLVAQISAVLDAARNAPVAGDETRARLTARIEQLLTEPACADIAERIRVQVAGGTTPHQLQQTITLLEERIANADTSAEQDAADDADARAADDDGDGLPF